MVHLPTPLRVPEQAAQLRFATVMFFMGVWAWLWARSKFVG
jgi:hypothetical protein